MCDIIRIKPEFLFSVITAQTTRVKTYHLSAKREGDDFFNQGCLMTENSNEGGFLFIMNLKI